MRSLPNVLLCTPTCLGVYRRHVLPVTKILPTKGTIEMTTFKAAQKLIKDRALGK